MPVAFGPGPTTYKKRKKRFKLLKGEQDALTCEELAAVNGVSHTTAWRRLTDLLEQGKARQVGHWPARFYLPTDPI